MTDEFGDDITPTNDMGDEQQPQADNEQFGELDKAREYGNNQKVRAEKAEAELKKLRAEAMANKSNKQENSETPKNEEQLNEPDYAKLAFLEGKGVNHPDDQKIVQDEAKRLKLPLTDVLGMEYIQSKLKTAKTQREAEAGMPDGSGKGVAGTKNTVEYWKDRKDPKTGQYLSPSDPKLHQEVIAARMAADSSAQMFDESLD